MACTLRTPRDFKDHPGPCSAASLILDGVSGQIHKTHTQAPEDQLLTFSGTEDSILGCSSLSLKSKCG